MEIVRFDASLAERIGRRPYQVKLASTPSGFGAT
jgi:hypothetical protein